MIQDVGGVVTQQADRGGGVHRVLQTQAQQVGQPHQVGQVLYNVESKN